jgi:hypothetical protein
VTRTPERACTLALAIAAAAVHLRLVLGSDPPALLTTWIPDDAFYYLLPAWNAAQGLGFSFDGMEPTYGFQPLWTMVLAVASLLLPTKAALVPTALLLGATLHVIAGLLIFLWFEREALARGGVVAAAIWLLNPNVVVLQASGMESCLVAVLLLATLLLLPSRGGGLSLGLALGLLFLARVSMLSMVVLVIAWLLWRRRPARTVAEVFLGLALVCIPWLLYATVALGQPLPASMDRKLVSGFAGAARFLADLPLVPDALLRAVLPAGERELFDVPGLIGPTWERLWRLGLRAPIGWAMGSWLPTRVSVSALVLLGGWSVLLARQRRALPLRVPTGLAVLIPLAVANVGSNNLLLSQYVEYGFWYRVPEVLTIVVLVGLAAQRAFGPARELGRPVLTMGAAVFLVALVSTASTNRPRTFDPTSPLMARGAYDVARSISDHLPAGTRVGSWNAGLLGWLTEGPAIVNLDGLANRPEFVAVAGQEVLFRHGVQDHLDLLQWLELNDIEYLVDLHPIDGLKQPFYGVIPADRVSFVLRSTAVDHWTLGGLDHAVILVRYLPEPVEPLSPPSAAEPR